MRALLLIIAVAGCGTEPSRVDDIAGPFTGSVQRFVIDRFSLPTDAMSSADLGDDLDGDRVVDNRAGTTLASLVSLDNITTHSADQIAAGVVASFVELQVDDLLDDPTAGVRYLGTEAAAADALGGKLAAGTFTSNRTRSTRLPVEIALRVPVFADADPIDVPMIGAQIDLTPDGRGGFDGLVRGALRPDDAVDATFTKMLQMIAANQRAHLLLVAFLDRDRDGTLTRDEGRYFLSAFLSPDVQLFRDGEFAATRGGEHPDSVSFGFGVHLAPCPTGNCARTTPANTCFDRVIDGHETDVDCGGSCQRTCAAAALCQSGPDCQTGICDAGRCTAPSCSNGILDGFESEVDCGGGCPTKCKLGQRCQVDLDCQSDFCDFGTTCKVE